MYNSAGISSPCTDPPSSSHTPDSFSNNVRLESLHLNCTHDLLVMSSSISCSTRLEGNSDMDDGTMNNKTPRRLWGGSDWTLCVCVCGCSPRRLKDDFRKASAGTGNGQQIRQTCSSVPCTVVKAILCVLRQDMIKKVQNLAIASCYVFNEEVTRSARQLDQFFCMAGVACTYDTLT